MVGKKNSKKGFSIAEALVSMLILSIFFLATSKVMTGRSTRDSDTNQHGYYECYVKNGSLVQKKFMTGADSQEEAVSSCTFMPSQGTAFVIIYALRSDGFIYKSVEYQFNTPINPISSIANLDNFYTQLGEVEENSLSKSDFGLYLTRSYPSSGLGALLQNGSYNNRPALFIGW